MDNISDVKFFENENTKVENFRLSNGQLVGFVVKIYDKYRPMIGRIVLVERLEPMIFIFDEGYPRHTLKQSIDFLNDSSYELAMILMKPVSSGKKIGHWLRNMLDLQ